jgi:hypothetical protein
MRNLSSDFQPQPEVVRYRMAMYSKDWLVSRGCSEEDESTSLMLQISRVHESDASNIKP